MVSPACRATFDWANDDDDEWSMEDHMVKHGHETTFNLGELGTPQFPMDEEPTPAVVAPQPSARQSEDDEDRDYDNYKQMYGDVTAPAVEELGSLQPAFEGHLDYAVDMPACRVEVLASLVDTSAPTFDASDSAIYLPPGALDLAADEKNTPSSNHLKMARHKLIDDRGYKGYYIPVLSSGPVGCHPYFFQNYCRDGDFKIIIHKLKIHNAYWVIKSKPGFNTANYYENWRNYKHLSGFYWINGIMGFQSRLDQVEYVTPDSDTSTGSPQFPPLVEEHSICEAADDLLPPSALDVSILNPRPDTTPPSPQACLQAQEGEVDKFDVVESPKPMSHEEAPNADTPLTSPTSSAGEQTEGGKLVKDLPEPSLSTPSPSSSACGVLYGQPTIAAKLPAFSIKKVCHRLPCCEACSVKPLPSPSHTTGSSPSSWFSMVSTAAKAASWIAPVAVLGGLCLARRRY
ncbi:hypothetical protein P154DRAFT_540633 [Amniculicola lignicola CBS 123094]|uniref:Uncharacterized protein n=1 Tax=Amniculicola lignicola CBS 123094 TaxID=1392246 RepID=A0A6A5W6B5_9PLEO|nr:hypothetical protein P154DRAFT_540633 [Amniculicola lignicola CBS 123094]